MAAEDFYCKRLGFRGNSPIAWDDAKADPCYMELDAAMVCGCTLVVSGDGISGGAVNLIV